MNESNFNTPKTKNLLKEIISNPNRKDRGGLKEEVGAILSVGTRSEIEKGQINLPSFYTILDLDPTASPLDLRREFRRIIRRYHPDSLRHTGVSAEDAQELGWRLTQLKKKLGI